MTKYAAELHGEDNEECKRYLHDIGVEGVCKHCGATGTVGDECDHCEPQDDLGPMVFQPVV